MGTRPNDRLDRAAPYLPHHLDELLEQLQRDSIDCLVLHGIPGGDEVRREQEELALSWRDKGYVKSLGVWEAGTDAREVYGVDNPYEVMLRPLNIARRDAAPAFRVSKEQMGWQNWAVSPFIRGWELDKMVEKALVRTGGVEPEIRAKLADLMLRFVVFHPHVDRVVVAMRRVGWIEANVASLRSGPLTDEESAWLDEVAEVEA